jgi:UDPglucose 6-dehydrogenase
MVDVRTKMGRRVLCTPDHPFVVGDGAMRGTAVKPADALDEADWLPLAMGEPRQDADKAASFDLGASLAAAGIREEDVIVRLAPEALGSLDRDRLRSAVRGLGHPRGNARVHDILRAGALRLPEARAAGASLEGATLGTARNGTYVPAVLGADAAFWRVVGLYVAEGHCTSDGRRMRLAWSFHPTDEEDLVREVAGFWRDRGVKVDVHRTETSRVVSISSRVLATWWLRVLGVGKDCYDQRIPDACWDSPPEHRRALLSGAWLGDGSRSLVRRGPSVVLEYGTVSRPLADGLLRILAESGLVARLKVGRTSKSTVDTYWLVLAGADQVERALDLVKPSDRGEIEASIARQAKRIAPTGYRSSETGGTWVRVVATRRVPFQGWVYSVEVPGAQTFVTTAGLVVHNCFPKDVKALIKTSEEAGLELHTVHAAERANERQKGVLFEKISKHFGGDLKGRTFGVWGLAFKPRTDDMREAPSIVLVRALLAAGAKVRASDPEAAKEARKVFGDTIAYCAKPYDALDGADALVLVTEWNEFRHPDFERMKKLLKTPVIFDGRNIYAGMHLAGHGWTVYGIGIPPAEARP